MPCVTFTKLRSPVLTVFLIVNFKLLQNAMCYFHQVPWTSCNSVSHRQFQVATKCHVLLSPSSVDELQQCFSSSISSCYKMPCVTFTKFRGRVATVFLIVNFKLLQNAMCYFHQVPWTSCNSVSHRQFQVATKCYVLLSPSSVDELQQCFS